VKAGQTGSVGYAFEIQEKISGSAFDRAADTAGGTAGTGGRLCDGFVAFCDPDRELDRAGDL
jgi:hypothetical protein